MAVANSRWSRKIVALLHDPPDKVFGVAGHKDRASELQRIALEREPATDEIDRAEQADWIASAADRVNFPEGTEVFWSRQRAALTHPLAGRSLDLGLLADVNVEMTHQAARRVVASFVGDAPPAQLFVRLWRCLPERLASELPQVSGLFGMLPADTRQPDHPLLQHLSITAAIADALPHPSLLVFSIGPVQEFIAAARRTQDLWMGSWLLSYLSWTAIKRIVETFGPDVIVFPSLRRQPLCDFWLARAMQVPVQPPRPEDLSLASLPNKFVALLPAPEARSAAEAAEQAVRNEWERLSDAVFTSLKNGIMPADDVTYQIWVDQVKAHLEVYWSVLVWPGENETSSQKQAEAVKSLFEGLCRPGSDWWFARVYDLYSKPKEEGGGQYKPNWGTTYSLLYALADRAFNARKVLRDFQQTEQKGEKCTVCGQRSALHGKDGSRSGVRAFWSRIATNLAARKRYTDIKPKGRERLCAICTMKRLVQREVLEAELGLKGDFPSTGEVAVASFKAAVLKKLSHPIHGEKLARALKDHLTRLKELNVPATVAGGAVPQLAKLRRQLANVSSEVQNCAEQLISYDGEAFFRETFTCTRLVENYGLSVDEEKIEAARRSLETFMRAATEAGISGPSKYYAALKMDGDHAGKWLSGSHERLATLREVLHPAVVEQLATSPEWRALLDERRLITPALHAAISDALATFSLKLVRFVVEERHAGRVVYAGGDDVLALLPVDEVLAAAQELRALYSGSVWFGEEARGFRDLRRQVWHVKFGDAQSTGYLWLDGAPLMTMGPTATASIGIAVAHHLQPLDLTLHAARQAEHAAKHMYDRDALCIYLLKRSGEEVRVGGRWSYPGVCEDITALMMDIYGRLCSRELSMRVTSTIYTEARTLSALSPQAQEAELRRLLRRHWQEETTRHDADDMAKRLVALASALEKVDKVGKRGLEQVADWLLLLRFLAKGGDE